MKLFRVRYEFHNRGTFLVKANTKEDVPKEFIKCSLEEMLKACNEGDGPFFCEDRDIEEVQQIL